MKIEKMLLKNFKSFKKGEVLFSDGFSVIGGPNGSGKSNVIDAICFVLGTGSMKDLRASRLTDLVNSTSNNDS
ncbi:MAG: AAA family ATPase, partial [Candidatus Diapherotrites archaeon]|nr:AAA family ATPase [Candidatus Diapherotrites archaeon]